MDPIIATGEADLCANTLSHEKKGPWLFYGIPGVYYYLVKIINYRDPYKNQPNISRKSSGLGAFFRGKKMGSSEFLKIPSILTHRSLRYHSDLPILLGQAVRKLRHVEVGFCWGPMGPSFPSFPIWFGLVHLITLLTCAVKVSNRSELNLSNSKILRSKCLRKAEWKSDAWNTFNFCRVSGWKIVGELVCFAYLGDLQATFTTYSYHVPSRTSQSQNYPGIWAIPKWPAVSGRIPSWVCRNFWLGFPIGRWNLPVYFLKIPRVSKEHVRLGEYPNCSCLCKYFLILPFIFFLQLIDVGIIDVQG